MARICLSLGEERMAVLGLIVHDFSLSTLETEEELVSKYCLGFIAKHEITVPYSMGFVVILIYLFFQMNVIITYLGKTCFCCFIVLCFLRKNRISRLTHCIQEQTVHLLLTFYSLSTKMLALAFTLRYSS